jgi:hypothetical protein
MITRQSTRPLVDGAPTGEGKDASAFAAVQYAAATAVRCRSNLCRRLRRLRCSLRPPGLLVWSRGQGARRVTVLSVDTKRGGPLGPPQKGQE